MQAPQGGRGKAISPTQLAAAKIMNFPIAHAGKLTVSVLGHLAIVSPGNDEGFVALTERHAGTVLDLHKEKLLLPALGSGNITIWEHDPQFLVDRVAYIYHQGLRIRAFRYEGVSYYASPSRLDIMKQDAARETAWGSGMLKATASDLFAQAKIPSLDKMFDENFDSCSTVYDFTIVWPAMSPATRSRIGAPYSVLSPRHRLCKNSYIQGPPGILMEERLPSDHLLLNEGVHGGQRFRAMPLSAQTTVDRNGEEHLGYEDFMNYGFVPTRARGTIMSPAHSNDMEAVELYHLTAEPYPLIVMSRGMYDRYMATVSSAATGELTRAYDLQMNRLPTLPLHLMAPEMYYAPSTPTPSLMSYPAMTAEDQRQQRLAFFLNSVNPSMMGFAHGELSGRYEEYRDRFLQLVQDAQQARIELGGTLASETLFPNLDMLKDGGGNYEEPHIREQIDLLDGLVSFAQGSVDDGGATQSAHPERIQAALRKLVHSPKFLKLRENLPRTAMFITSAADEWRGYSINEATRNSRAQMEAIPTESTRRDTSVFGRGAGLPSMRGYPGYFAAPQENDGADLPWYMYQ